MFSLRFQILNSPYQVQKLIHRRFPNLKTSILSLHFMHMFLITLNYWLTYIQANSVVWLRQRRTLSRGSCIKASMALSAEDQDGKLEQKRIPHVMTVAGSDSGAGAGIQADLKTCAARRVYCSTVITAVTAQNTVGVQGVCMMAEEFVAEQMKSVLSDMQVDVVKTGMLPSVGITKVLLDCISQFPVRGSFSGGPCNGIYQW